MAGRGFSVVSRDGHAAAPCDGQFEYRHPRCAKAPPTGVRDLPDPGPNNEEPAKDLDTAESITDSAGGNRWVMSAGTGQAAVMT